MVLKILKDAHNIKILYQSFLYSRPDSSRKVSEKWGLGQVNFLSLRSNRTLEKLYRPFMLSCLCFDVSLCPQTQYLYITLFFLVEYFFIL